jgi:hypothetical protein
MIAEWREYSHFPALLQDRRKNCRPERAELRRHLLLFFSQSEREVLVDN